MQVCTALQTHNHASTPTLRHKGLVNMQVVVKVVAVGIAAAVFLHLVDIKRRDVTNNFLLNEK